MRERAALAVLVFDLVSAVAWPVAIVLGSAAPLGGGEGTTLMIFEEKTNADLIT